MIVIMRKHLTAIICLSISAIISSGEPLKEIERVELLERLQHLSEKDDRLQVRFQAAARALTAALADENAAVSLYESSVEKIFFEDEHRKQMDFREWKKRHSKMLSSKGFRRALMHRYQWMVLTLKASRMSEETFSELSPDVEKAMTRLIKDAPFVAPIFKVRKNDLVNQLEKSPMKGVVARRFGIETINVPEEWPENSLSIADVYEKIIFPPLRNEDSLEQLSSAWDRRILCEKRFTEATIWGEEKRRNPSGRYDRFNDRKMPQLIWSKEKDLYSAGDQRGSSARMLQFIEENATSPDASNWIKEFGELLNNQENKAKSP